MNRSLLGFALSCLVLGASLFGPALPFAFGGVRTSPPAGTVFSGGGGAPLPNPPTSLATLGVLRVPTLINVTSGSSSGPWVVHVRDGFGTLISTGVTDRSGDVVQVLPMLPGLRLDVIGTDAVDVPVVAGTVLEIWLP